MLRLPDYEFESVPQEARLPGWKLLLIWLAVIFTVVIFAIGGVLSQTLPLRETVAIVVGGNLILALIAGTSSYIGYRSGRSFGMWAIRLFGSVGGKLVNATLVPLVLTGWFVINTSLLGATWARALHLAGVGESVLILTVGLMMTSTAWLGIRAIGWLSYVSVPAVLILSILGLSRAVPSLNLNAGPSEAAMPLIDALDMVIATWILGSIIVIMDIMRFAKSAWTAWLSPGIGLIFGNSFVLLSGAIAGYAAGNPNLVEIMTALGLLLPALALMTLSLWSTNDSGLYSTGLALSSGLQLPKKLTVLLAGGIGTLLALARPHEAAWLTQWLLILSRTVPPLGGILFAHWLLYRERDEVEPPPDWGGIAFLAWAVGIVVALQDFWLHSLQGLLAAGLVYLGLGYYHVKKQQEVEMEPGRS